MTPREQIEWIRDDVSKLCEGRPRLPKLMYLVNMIDCRESQSDLPGPVAPGDCFQVATCAGYVEVVGDPNVPRGRRPFRAYRCPCGRPFPGDFSRSGKCDWCLNMAIRTTVGDIPIVADPTLGTGEFRIEPTPGYPRPPERLHEGLRKYVLDCRAEFLKKPMPKRSITPGRGGLIMGAPTAAFQGIDRNEPVQSLRIAPPLRPDGFAQNRIDEIKAMLLTPAPRRGR